MDQQEHNEREKNWNPVLLDETAIEVKDAISAIASDIDAVSDDLETYWAAALLHAYLFASRGEPAEGELAEHYRAKVIAAVAERMMRPALYGGLAGAAWLCAHLDSMSDGQDDADYLEIDEALLAFAKDPLRHGYDLISGAVGIGVYFLERLPSKAAVEGLHRIGVALHSAADCIDEYATWHTPAASLPEWQRRQAPQGYYNLGVAHGISGIIGLLAECGRAKLLDAELEVLLRKSVRWLLRQRLANGLLPSWVGEEITPTKSRIAWCYGELGASVTVAAAADVLGVESWFQAALEMALASAARADVGSAQDGCLCHGAAGNGHLFNRLFQATGREEFREAAGFWFRRTLEMRVHTNGVGGYRVWRPFTPDELPKDDPWEIDPSFLSGAAGIALALLSATTSINPDWDRVLLCRL
jgi:lantibiotic modifying enzyme